MPHFHDPRTAIPVKAQDRKKIAKLKAEIEKLEAQIAAVLAPYLGPEPVRVVPSHVDPAPPPIAGGPVEVHIIGGFPVGGGSGPKKGCYKDPPGVCYPC